MSYGTVVLDDYSKKKRKRLKPRKDKGLHVQIFAPYEVWYHFRYKHKSNQYHSMRAYTSAVFIQELESGNKLHKYPHMTNGFKINIDIPSVLVPKLELLQSPQRCKSFRELVARIFFNGLETKKIMEAEKIVSLILDAQFDES